MAGRRGPTLGDRPDDQGRTPVHVTGHEDTVGVGLPVRSAGQRAGWVRASPS